MEATAGFKRRVKSARIQGLREDVPAGCWKAAKGRSACGDSSVQTTISARHGHLSPATQARITEKVEVVRKFFNRLTAISVLADLEHKDRAMLELRVRAEHHDEFVAIAEADTVFAALDGAI